MTTVVYGRNRALILRCSFSLDCSNKGGEQDIQLTNDKRIVAHYNDPKSAGKTADPGKFTPWVTMYNNQPERRHLESRKVLSNHGNCHLIVSDFRVCGRNCKKCLTIQIEATEKYFPLVPFIWL